jgi:type I restriction enzyme, S subunit
MSESNGLPRGWAEATVDDLSQVVRGISFPTNAKHPTPHKGDIACLRTANVQAEVEWDDLWYVPETYVGREEQFVQEDDILISTANSYELVGKVARVRRVPMRSSLGAFIALMRCREVVTPAFFHHQMCSLEVSTRLRSMASTTTNISNISTGKLRELGLRIAPLPEQHRIVEKIDELFSDLDAGVASLQRAKTNLKRYRSSVLKAAVEGRLTEEWRKEHPQGEDGQMLPDRILRERRQKWEKEQLQKFKEKGKEPPKNWESKYEEPSAPDTSELPDLPEGWVWASLMQMTNVITSGSRDWTQYYGAGSGTFLMAQNVRNGSLDLSFRQAVNPPASDRDRIRSEVALNDLLVTIVGANTGDVCRVPTHLPEHYVCQSVALMRCVRPEMANYLEVFFIADHGGQKYFQKCMYGQGRPHLGFDDLKLTPIPLPPLAEQEQIVALVEERLSQIDSAEKTIDSELIRSQRLRQSILKTAFEGKLVPQDRNDEPASVLLERIKASRDSEQPKKKAKKATKARAK